MKLLIAMLALFGLTGQNSSHPSYAAGQIWEYKARPSDTGSLLKIQRVEADAKGHPIYHISVIGVKLGAQTDRKLPHLPVSGETLDKSVTHLSTATTAFPNPSEGIDTWREAKGGVFTIPVADIVTIVDKQMAIPDGE